MSVTGYIVLVAALLLLSIAYYASFFIDSGVYVKTLCRSGNKEHRIALTFDDGPEGTMTPRVLDVLGKYQVQAAFFLIGEKARVHPELVVRMVEEGHIIGSHSLTHAGLFPFKNRDKIYAELEKTRCILKEITGKRINLFRPPFGVTNPSIAVAIRKGGYRTVGWSVRAFDTCRHVARERILKRLMKGLHPGAVVLLHDRCCDADVLLEKFIVSVREKGYEIVGLDELLNIQAYEN